MIERQMRLMNGEIEKLRPTSAEELVEGAALVGNSIPLIGGVASSIALHSMAGRRWDRLLDFLKSIEKELGNLKGVSADQEEIAAEVLDRVIRERSQEKTECYRNILLNAVKDDALDYDLTIDIVKLVDGLTPNHIKLLSVLRDPLEADRQLGGKVARKTANLHLGSHATFLYPFFPDWGAERLGRLWDDLHRLHILDQGFPSAMGGSFTLEGLSNYISSFGRGVLSYILESDS